MGKNRRFTIHTQRLSLCRIQPNDKDSLLEILKDPRVYKTYMVPDLETNEEENRMFHRIKSLSESEDRFVYGIYLDSALIGLINEVDKTEDTVELGFVIHPSHQRRGFASEALAACIDELFEMGYASVKTGAFEENAASIRVMEKCGMTRIEKTENIDYRGKVHRCVFYESIDKCPARDNVTTIIG